MRYLHGSNYRQQVIRNAVRLLNWRAPTPHRPITESADVHELTTAVAEEVSPAPAG